MINVWILYTILSALFSSLMMICVKVGLKDLDSNIGLFIRTTIVVFFCLIYVVLTSKTKDIKTINNKTWLWLLLSSVATYLTWFFYFKAVKNGEISNVMALDKVGIIFTIFLSFIFFKERITSFDILGSIIVLLGIYMIIYK